MATANSITVAPTLRGVTDYNSSYNSSLFTTKSTDMTGYFYQVEQLTFLWVLFTIIVIGNSTVLIALMLSKGRKSRMNFFIKHLAASDLCVGLISVLTDIIWRITISWEAGVVACKLIRFSQAVVTYASTYVLVALSIDRYDAITHPMNFSGSWRRAKGLVAAAWILSAIFSSPILVLYYTKETEDYGTQCWINFPAKWQWKLYMTLVSVTLFVIPAILIGGCYIIIVCTIWNKGKEMQGKQSTSNKNGAATTTTAGGTVIQVASKSRGSEDELESRRASSRGLIPKAKVKTVKMTFVIIFVFILCWSPYIIFDLLQVYGCIPDNSTNLAVATFIQSMAPLNSAANPLIYCLFSTNIGQTLCNLMGCRKRPADLSTGMTTSTNSQTKPLVGGTNSSTARMSSSSAAVTTTRHLRNGAASSTLRQPLFESSTASIQQPKNEAI